MAHAEKIQREKLESLKGQLAYTTDCLMNHINEMEDWEVKEYVAVSLDYKEEISQLQQHISEVF